MSSTPWGGVRAVLPRPTARGMRGLAISNGETAAWLVLLPCAAVVVAAVALLGPPLGELLVPARPAFSFWNPAGLRPQPHIVGRFLVALLGPLVLSAAIVATVRRQPQLPPRLVATTTAAAQALVVCAIVACFAGQHHADFKRVYFTTATLVAAAVIAGLLAVAARSERLRASSLRVLRESRGRRWVALAAAVVLTAIWLLHAVNDDRSIAWANEMTSYHVGFYLDETFALLNGLAPLATFTPQYGSLWPYVVAVPMLVFGKTMLVFSIAMCTISAFAFLAIFGVFRRVTRSSVAALLLFAPFLATSLFRVFGTFEIRHTYGAYFAMHPLRFAGPFLLAWLTARQLSRAGGTRSWLLFAVAGVVTINNTDFGVAALGATIAALLWANALWTRPRSLLPLAANVAAGLVLAIAVVSLLTLAVSGTLPQWHRLTEFARIYGLNGFNSIAMPERLGLPIVIYMTHVAAIATATVLAVRRDENRVLTGMLAWAGVFGLGSAVYYVSRANPEVLVYTFSPWAISLALLAVATLRRFADPAPLRRCAIGVAVLFGVGLTVSSLAQFPWPATQLERIRVPVTGYGNASEGPFEPSIDVTYREFVSSLADGPRRFVVRAGAPVAILATTGHRIADAYDVRNVTPYTGYDSLNTREQLEDTLDALRAAGGNTVLAPRWDNEPFNRALIERGFKLVTERGLRAWPKDVEGAEAVGVMNDLQVVQMNTLVKWVDTRYLHPAALR